MKLGDESRAATPVVGNVLLVAVVVVVATALVILSFTFLEQTGAPTAEAAFEYERTSVGLKMTPTALGTDVVVKLSGERVATIEADSAGESVLVPTAPGDRITVVSQDEQRSILVSKTIDDRDEVGDFIAYYDFEEFDGNGDAVDGSQNGNTGTLRGSPQRIGNGLRFDRATSDYVDVQNVDSSVNVSEITVAVSYRSKSGQYKRGMDLVEHINTDGSNWLLTEQSQARIPVPADKHRLAFNVDKSGGSQTKQVVTGRLNESERHVAVGTFDGETLTLYVDGQKIGTNSYSSPIEVGVGRMTLGRDAEASVGYYRGDMYEFRLYYASFDETEVQAITEAMS